MHRLRKGRRGPRHARAGARRPDTKSGTPGADAVKVKGNITWVGAKDALPATVVLYDRLFTEAQPEAGGRDFSSSAMATSLPTELSTVPNTLFSTASPRSKTAGRSDPRCRQTGLR